MFLAETKLDWGAFVCAIVYVSVVERSVALCLKQSF